MLTKNTQMNRDQIEMIALEQLVPANHLVRKIEAAIDFTFIYALVQDMYSSDRGRPSIDPVVLMAFIQYTFGIRSMRKTIEQIETDSAYRWFLGFGFYDKVPHFSTFGKNYERRFKDTDLFEQIFYHILKEASEKKLISSEYVFIDSTHVKASANKHKFEKKVVRKESKAYEARLQKRLTKTVKIMGKSHFLQINLIKKKLNAAIGFQFGFVNVLQDFPTTIDNSNPNSCEGTFGGGFHIGPLEELLAISNDIRQAFRVNGEPLCPMLIWSTIAGEPTLLLVDVESPIPFTIVPTPSILCPAYHICINSGA